MEDAIQHVELVQRVRHAFQPSVQLENALETFIKPGYERPRFLIKTLSSFVLHYSDTYADVLTKAEEYTEAQKVDLHIGPHFAAKRMGSGALKLLMSLESVHNGNNIDVNKVKYMSLIHNTNKLIPDAEVDHGIYPKKFTFYTEIGANAAIPDSELVSTGMPLVVNLRNEATRRFFHLSLDSLTTANELATTPSNMRQ